MEIMPGPRREPPRGVDNAVLPGRWISPADAGRQLGLGERTVRRRCAAGELPCSMGLHGWMVDADRLDRHRP
jgi:hypothetical protein